MDHDAVPESHASADRSLGEAIKTRVAHLGVETWLAEHDHQAGRRLEDKVHAALRRSTLLVVLLTRAGFDSHYVQQEIGAARHAGTLVIPMVDLTVDTDNDMAMLEGVEWISFDPDAPADAISQLTDQVAA